MRAAYKCKYKAFQVLRIFSQLPQIEFRQIRVPFQRQFLQSFQCATLLSMKPESKSRSKLKLALNYCGLRLRNGRDYRSFRVRFNRRAARKSPHDKRYFIRTRRTCFNKFPCRAAHVREVTRRTNRRQIDSNRIERAIDTRYLVARRVISSDLPRAFRVIGVVGETIFYNDKLLRPHRPRA